MIEKLRTYLGKRVHDPLSWLALSFVAPWAAGAIWGISPFLLLNGVCLAYASAEWWALWVWRRRERQLRADVLESLSPPTDRWKSAWLAVVGGITIALEFWINSRVSSLTNLGITALGLSTMFALWYAWSRPLLVARAGLIVGASLVPWRDVALVSWNGTSNAPTVRFDFRVPHFFYGTKVRATAAVPQMERIKSLLPPWLSGLESVSGG